MSLPEAITRRALTHDDLDGQTRVTLGVDAQNATGATQLYESIGMHAEAEAIVFEKAPA